MSKASLEEKIAAPLAKIYENLLHQDELYIQSKSISIEFWQMELKSLLDNEPFYLFKKKHKEWEEKVKNTKEHLDELYKSQEEAIIESKSYLPVKRKQ